jgi:TRAP-type uncharacterized transport system substrate-binding protein
MSGTTTKAATAGSSGKVSPPKIARSITLSFKGDWGRANLHRALGWLSYEMVQLTGPYTNVTISNGRGALDNALAVARGQIDVSLVTPGAFTRMVLDGKGPCAGSPYPHIRALGYVPQDDRMIFAIRKELGISNLDDLRKKKPKLRITAGIDDGVGFMGMGAQRLLAASGISRADIESWGGNFIEREEPMQCLREMMTGSADAIIQEAVMTAGWIEMADKLDLVFLPIEPQARDTLKKELGWPSARLPKDYLRGMDREMEFLDFSHFLLVTTTDLPDDVAYALSWSLVETFDVLEQQYRHIPVRRSPVTYPLDPRATCRTPIPLHAGAERYFRDAGHL